MSSQPFLPENMMAIEISEPGEPNVLKPVNRPLPVPGKQEVLIKIEAAGVNRPDVLQRKGAYPPPAGASDLPGLEVSGTIVAGDVTGSNLNIGDKVCALLAGGGYAEYCVAPLQQCLPVPEGLSFIEAAGIPETYFTVWSNVFDRGGLSEGETLLVHGGASGIGTTAVVLATAMGYTVYATAGSDERCRAVEQLGAKRCINYRTQNFVEKINQVTNGKGVDVILDMVAGDYIEKNINCLADDGRIVIIAVLGGTKANINCAQILMRRLTITGSTLRARPVKFKADIASSLYKHVWPLFNNGKIKPVVHKVFPLDQAAAAHKLMENGDQIGKIILSTS